jgi:hypothetical protein
MAGAIAVLMLLAPPSLADESELTFAIKATYVYKFAPFVTWPATQPRKNTFDLCIAGDDGVTKALPAVTAGQQIDGRPIAVRRVAGTDSPESCQIFYISNDAAASAWLDAVRGKPILTVTDAAMPNHGIIGFTVIDHHVRFDIDNSMAAGAGLTISSKLLSLANAVTPVLGDAR